MVLENKQWSNAANLELNNLEFPWNQHPWEKAILHFARALGASHTGDIEAAEKEFALLQSSRQKLLNIGDNYSANQVLVLIKTCDAWISFARGNAEEAVVLMTAAADIEDNTGKHPVTPGEVLPARELLGDLLMAMNKPSEALEAYEKSLLGHQIDLTAFMEPLLPQKMLVMRRKQRCILKCCSHWLKTLIVIDLKSKRQENL